jgi:hypothetical protein
MLLKDKHIALMQLKGISDLKELHREHKAVVSDLVRGFESTLCSIQNSINQFKNTLPITPSRYISFSR